MYIVIATLLLASFVAGHPATNYAGEDSSFTIRIVHTNDMHARFEQTSKYSSTCSPEEAANKKCYGGFARIATLVRELRKSGVPSLFLNAGDTYQGSIWFNVYKWRIVSQFLNILRPDAISLGNHEFDDGVNGLIPFIENSNFPIVTANLDLSKEPKLAATKLLNHTILDVNGTKVAVIGYLTPETTDLASTGEVIFRDEVVAIREQVEILKKTGIKIFIAVGHSGFETDKRIAAEVDGIDLVIGGHTNTFLYTGENPDSEKSEGFYPTEVVQKNGRKVYVVQAYAYTKYLGNFNVTFDSEGEVTKIIGNPILVDSSIEEAKDVLDELDKLRPKVEEMYKKIVGRTHVLLNGDSKICRKAECNFGNLITDALVDYNAMNTVSKDGWTDAPIAVQNSGAIRASITRANDNKISMADLWGVFPFESPIVKIRMTGAQIWEMLEWSAHFLVKNSTANLHGAFLQVSGLQVVYNLDKPEFERVVSVQARCGKCKVPEFSELKLNETYNVLANDFMRTGGDGYKLLKNLPATSLIVSTADVMEKYFERMSPVYPGVEWRLLYHSSGLMVQPILMATLLPLISWFLMR